MAFDVVIVLGMHRSGTSAITRSLVALGIELGKNTVGGNAYNQKGYFEDPEVVKINDTILEKLGSNWASLKFLGSEPLKGLHFKEERIRAARWVKEMLSQGKPIGFKDPRLCRTLPFWQKVFEEMGLCTGYLLIYRNPNEVAASIVSRGLGITSIDYAKSLWCAYQVDALRHLKSQKWLAVKYDLMLKRPVRELERIAKFLGVAWDPDSSGVAEYSNQFLDSSLRHHQARKGIRKRFKFHFMLVSMIELVSRTRNDFCQWAVRAAAEQVFHKMKKDTAFSILENKATWVSWHSRPGFWRRLERSIRKRRKRWIAGIGFDRDWYLQEYQDVTTAGIDPLEHYQNHGINEGRFKNKKQKNKFRSLNINESTTEKSEAKTYNYLNFNPDSVLQSRIPRIQFDPRLSLPVPYQKNSAINPFIKLIAFYLPQFHPFPENDIWWGKGFTEWTNVGRALPNFSGHYQPHCPIHLGYYDLRVPSVMEEQVALAKNYGIYGFNYYFYWFAGKTLMEAPLQAMLNSKKIDMPFCLTWANENWTRKWDGLERDILIAQKHSEEDSQAFIRHLFQYFRDPRYITVSGKPVLIVYRPDIIPQIKATAALWRSEMTKAGFTGIYLMSAQTFRSTSPEPFGFDAAVEFPPHTSVSGSIAQECKDVRPDFKGVVFSYEQAASAAIQTSEPPYKRFRTAMLSWDNTARNQNTSHVFHGFSLQIYKQWLNSLCTSCFSASKYSADEKLVFINAWNEWAEGTHLEPDQKYGYGYLHVTREVVQQFDMSSLSALSYGPVTKTSDLAIVAHVHYEDVWPELNRHIQIAFPKGCDLFVTVTSARSAAVVRRDFPKAYIILVENRGRDILPFLKVFKMIHNSGYTAICKVHTKKSTYRDDGDKLRHGLLGKLLGSSGNVGHVAEMFKADESLGLLCPTEFLLPHTDRNMTFDHEVVSCVADLLKLSFKYSLFPAGSMFWFRPEALLKLNMLEDTLFPPESGWADGTPAHAVERIFGVVAQSSGFTLKCL